MVITLHQLIRITDMSDFDKAWCDYTKLYDPDKQQAILVELQRARNIVFVAKGRVGLACKMFMQRLSQQGLRAYHSEDLQVPNLDSRDLVVFVTASGNTASSFAYIDIAQKTNAKTMSITFNANGRISSSTDICIEYSESKLPMLMKSYHELGFIYIFEKLISHFPAEVFVHTNFE
jgi:DNA-binding MurR/RpiR family transcriptional regulator